MATAVSLSSNYTCTIYDCTTLSRVSNLATKLAVLSTMFLTSGGGYIIPTIGLVAGVSSAGSSFWEETIIQVMRCTPKRKTSDKVSLLRNYLTHKAIQHST